MSDTLGYWEKRGAVSAWDFAFGKKIELTLPGIGKRQVTRKWFDAMQRRGLAKISAAELRVRILTNAPADFEPEEFDELLYGHSIDSHYRVEKWIVGKDISSDQVDKWQDPETGDIYVIQVFENGTLSSNFVRRDLFETTREQLDAVDRELNSPQSKYLLNGQVKEMAGEFMQDMGFTNGQMDEIDADKLEEFVCFDPGVDLDEFDDDIRLLFRRISGYVDVLMVGCSNPLSIPSRPLKLSLSQVEFEDDTCRTMESLERAVEQVRRGLLSREPTSPVTIERFADYTDEVEVFLSQVEAALNWVVTTSR